MNKTKRLTLRLLPEERLVVELLAEQERQRKSDVVRGLIRQAAQDRGVWELCVQRSRVAGLVVEMKGD